MESSNFLVEVKKVSTVTLEISTQGRVNIEMKNVPIFILEEEMEEVLLGDDVLKKLGINVGEAISNIKSGKIDYRYLKETQTFPHMGGTMKNIYWRF